MPPRKNRTIEDLIVRLDERTCNIYHLTERVEWHQREQNNQIILNRNNISWLKRAVGAGITVGIAVISLISHSLGWW